ncbi:hypothetical protein CHARACLAT_024723, partial [Characodon lateralis]|nr:hypothetical protein [Characodon lateralis]
MLLELLTSATHSQKGTFLHWKANLVRKIHPLDPRRWSLRLPVQRSTHRWTTAPSSRIKPRPVFTRALGFGEKLAIVDSSGKHTYKQLYCSSLGLASRISATLNSDFGGLDGRRISFLCANDASYVVAQWATWMSGGTAVPLCRKHPLSELEYIISDSQTSLLLAAHPYGEALEPLAQKLGLPCLTLPPTSDLNTLDDVGNPSGEEENVIREWADHPAMIVYTSGTTGRPKGVLHTHSSIQAM